MGHIRLPQGRGRGHWLCVNTGQHSPGNVQQWRAQSGGVEVPLGSDVVLRVTSDVADELHLHGYDQKADLQAGVPGELRFRADIPGIFELELEQVGKKLTRLQVR